MARVDVPTLQCDRCKVTTQSKNEMVAFKRVQHSHISGNEEWDLCPSCWEKFRCLMIGWDVVAPRHQTADSAPGDPA